MAEIVRRWPTAKGVVNIRVATSDDALLLRMLRLEALAAHPVAFAADHDRTAAETASAWVERIGRNEANQEGVIYVAAAEDRLLGMTGLYRGHWPKTEHSANIWGVYVTAAWRGQGIAGALLEACIDWARAHGIIVVKLGVVTTNAPAIRCYIRCGFTVYGLEPQVIRYDGVLYDELMMVKPI